MTFLLKSLGNMTEFLGIFYLKWGHISRPAHFIPLIVL
jgi:hypothetical protein